VERGGLKARKALQGFSETEKVQRKPCGGVDAVEARVREAAAPEGGGEKVEEVAVLAQQCEM